MTEPIDLQEQEAKVIEPFRMTKREAFLIRMLFGSIIGLVFGILLSIMVIKSTPGTSSVWIYGIISAAIFGWYAAFIMFRNNIIRIEIGHDMINLTRESGEIEKIFPDDVVFITGIGGVNFDGGDIIQWKYILLVTKRSSYRLRFKEACSTCFIELLRVCPEATAVPYQGPIRWPQSAQIGRAHV